METTKRTALVTGAAGSIGSAICRAFAADGVRLILVDLDQAKLETLAASLPVAAWPLAMDIGDPVQVAAGCRRAAQEFSPVDILVNNAGILSNNKLLATTIEEWRRVLAVNLDGAFLLSQQVLPHLKEQRWGRIINIASVVGEAGNPGQANYVASKAGIIGLTKCLAQELASRNITVNAIAPGFIDTDMTAVLTEEQKQKMMVKVPLNRLGQPQDIANAVKFLASDDASYITGQVLRVNGGMYM